MQIDLYTFLVVLWLFGAVFHYFIIAIASFIKEANVSGNEPIIASIFWPVFIWIEIIAFIIYCRKFPSLTYNKETKRMEYGKKEGESPENTTD